MMSRIILIVQAHVLLGIASSLVTHSIPWNVPCPQKCVCQIRSWYSPKSAYREAPTVDCNDLLLSQLPAKLPLETQTLRLQSNLITNLDQRDLQGLTNLTELDLSQNTFSNPQVTHIPALLSLHMEENQLHHIPDSAFSGLPNLQELYLNHNQLRTISPGAFMGLRNLLRLHLNSNHLRMIDRRWFHDLPKLEVLMIGGNLVDTIQDLSFTPLRSLRSLVLAGMGLQELSERALEGLSSLESISFYDNHLAKAPKSALQTLPGLKFLDMNKNPIQLVQKGDFKDMLLLKELGLNNMENLVSIEHSAMDNLPELTKLEITSDPRLPYIHPKAFQQLRSMESLMLNSNALSALHRQTILSLPSLKEISLHTNPIRCDCLIRWVGAEDDKPVRFIDPQSTFCSEPPDLKDKRVKEVSFQEMSESCLPLIAPGTFPHYFKVRHGDNLALHCQPLAEPEPSIYWVSPKGLRLIPFTSHSPYQVLAEGTLEILGITTEEAGFYTCVAQNLVGADTWSVTFQVSGRRRFNPVNRKQSNHFKVKEVSERYAVLAWQASHNVPNTRLSWLAKGSLEDQHKLSVHISAGTRAINLTHLQSGTHYRVCLHQGTNDTSCLHLRTKDIPVPVSPPDLTPAVLIAASALFLLLIAKACQSRVALAWNEQEHKTEKLYTAILPPEVVSHMSLPPLQLQQQTGKVLSDDISTEKSNTEDAQTVQGSLGETC